MVREKVWEDVTASPSTGSGQGPKPTAVEVVAQGKVYGYWNEKHYRWCMRSGVGPPPGNAACSCAAVELEVVKPALDRAEQERDAARRISVEDNEALQEEVKLREQAEARVKELEEALLEARNALDACAAQGRRAAFEVEAADAVLTASGSSASGGKGD